MFEAFDGNRMTNPLAERCLLTALVERPEHIPAVAAILTADQFWVDPHARLYESFLMMEAAGAVINMVTVSHHAWKRKEWLWTASPPRIFEQGYQEMFADDITSTLSYAGVIGECAQRRTMMAAASDLARRAGSGEHITQTEGGTPPVAHPVRPEDKLAVPGGEGRLL